MVKSCWTKVVWQWCVVVWLVLCVALVCGTGLPHCPPVDPEPSAQELPPQEAWTEVARAEHQLYVTVMWGGGVEGGWGCDEGEAARTTAVLSWALERLGRQHTNSTLQFEAIFAIALCCAALRTLDATPILGSPRATSDVTPVTVIPWEGRAHISGLQSLWRGCDGGGGASGVARAVLQSRALEPWSCGAPALLMMAPSTPARLAPALQESGLAVVRLADPGSEGQLTAAATLLQLLGADSVVLLTDHKQPAQQFGQEAALRGVCITALYSIAQGLSAHEHEASDPEYVNGEQRPLVTVILGTQASIREHLGALEPSNTSSWALRPLLLLPTDGISQLRTVPLSPILTGALAVGRGEVMLRAEGSAGYETVFEQYGLQQALSGAYRAWETVLRAAMRHCGGPRQCDQMRPPAAGKGVAHPSVAALQEELGVVLVDGGVKIYQTTIPDGGQTEALLQIGAYTAGRVRLSPLTVLERGWRLVRGAGDGGGSTHCVNAPTSPLSQLVWAPQLWTVAAVTVAGVGTATALTIAAFLMKKCCEGSASEGSQWLSLVVLGASLLQYGALLPFTCRPTPLSCALRSALAGGGYTGAFAALLARSVLLATADAPGLVGHVSGVVQVSLLLSLVAVQVGLTLQSWLFSGPSLQFVVPSSHYRCSPSGVLWLLLSLSYPASLLLLQVLVSPFTVRSRRNYREGLLFCIASFILAALWGAWLALYLLLPEFEDLAVCLGLTTCPTVLIVSVFIPKTFLMVRSSSAAAVTVDPSKLDPQALHYRGSNLGLYESIEYLHDDSGHVVDPRYVNEPTLRYVNDSPLNQSSQSINSLRVTEF